MFPKCNVMLGLDHQPLFGKGARAPSRGERRTRHERTAEIEPIRSTKKLMRYIRDIVQLIISCPYYFFMVNVNYMKCNINKRDSTNSPIFRTVMSSS